LLDGLRCRYSSSYEKPEADVLLRKPRNTKKDKLVDWKLLFHAYFFLGIQESLCSFAMAYWYAQRKGVHFSVLWLGYGEYPASYQPFVSQVLAEASSIYFVTLVEMRTSPNPSPTPKSVLIET
jgi:sodium/potassium-transporting ATPase subunit alpha